MHLYPERSRFEERIFGIGRGFSVPHIARHLMTKKWGPIIIVIVGSPVATWIPCCHWSISIGQWRLRAPTHSLRLLKSCQSKKRSQRWNKNSPMFWWSLAFSLFFECWRTLKELLFFYHRTVLQKETTTRHLLMGSLSEVDDLDPDQTWSSPYLFGRCLRHCKTLTFWRMVFIACEMPTSWQRITTSCGNTLAQVVFTDRSDRSFEVRPFQFLLSTFITGWSLGP